MEISSPNVEPEVVTIEPVESPVPGKDLPSTPEPTPTPAPVEAPVPA